MALRPELLPPVLDPELVERLAELADRLDGTKAGELDFELAEFNRLADTDLPIEEFCDIYSAMSPEDFVRGVLFRKITKPLPDITVEEMTEIVTNVMELRDDHDFYLTMYHLYCNHPLHNGLIYWPNLVDEFPKDREPTAREIAELALRGT